MGVFMEISRRQFLHSSLAMALPNVCFSAEKEPESRYKESKKIVEDDTGKYFVHLYEPRGNVKSKGRFVGIAPILGGHHIPESILAGALASVGYVSSYPIVPSWKEIKSVEELEKVVSLRQKRFDSAIKLGNAKFNGNYGVIGIGLGGITAMQFLTGDEKVKACVLGFTGGELGTMFMQSQVSSLKNMVKSFLESNKNMSREQLEEKLNNLSYDPLNNANEKQREKVFMIMHKGNMIPEKSQIALFDKLGSPKFLSLKGNTASLFTQSDKITKASLEFITSALDK